MIIYSNYDQTTKRLTVEDVVHLETGEVVTDQWFESGIVFDKNLIKKAEKEARSSQIDDFLSGLSI